jgi:hypothetical protein
VEKSLFDVKKEKLLRKFLIGRKVCYNIPGIHERFVTATITKIDVVNRVIYYEFFEDLHGNYIYNSNLGKNLYEYSSNLIEGIIIRKYLDLFKLLDIRCDQSPPKSKDFYPFLRSVDDISTELIPYEEYLNL